MKERNKEKKKKRKGLWIEQEIIEKEIIKCKAVPVTGREGP
jgi:hypothetical protein